MPDPLLQVEGLHAAYGQSAVLHGVTLSVAPGEVVTLMGRNGMGKTTTLRCIIGLVRATAGSIRFAGQDITGWRADRMALAGIGWVPEGRRIFRTLTVEENLLVAARGEAAGWSLGRVYAIFPRLRERRSNPGPTLSGGEQQMLAIGRALMTNPRLLLLDEATEGLSPLVRKEIWHCIEALRTERQAILIVDKHIEALRALGDRHHVMQKGSLVWSGSSADLGDAYATVSSYLSVS